MDRALHCRAVALYMQGTAAVLGLRPDEAFVVGWHSAGGGGRPPCGTWRPCMPPTSWATNCRWKWNSWRLPLLEGVYGTSSCMSGSGDRQSAGVALKRNQRPSPTPWAASGTGTPVGGIPWVRGNARHPLYLCAPMIAAKPGPTPAWGVPVMMSRASCSLICSSLVMSSIGTPLECHMRAKSRCCSLVTGPNLLEVAQHTTGTGPHPCRLYTMRPTNTTPSLG